MKETEMNTFASLVSFSPSISHRSPAPTRSFLLLRTLDHLHHYVDSSGSPLRPTRIHACDWYVFNIYMHLETVKIR